MSQFFGPVSLQRWKEVRGNQFNRLGCERVRIDLMAYGVAGLDGVIERANSAASPQPSRSLERQFRIEDYGARLQSGSPTPPLILVFSLVTPAKAVNSPAESVVGRAIWTISRPLASAR